MIQLAWASSADQLVITKTGLPHPAYTDSTGCWLQSSRTTSRITYLPQLYFIFLAYTKPTLILLIGGLESRCHQQHASSAKSAGLCTHLTMVLLQHTASGGRRDEVIGIAPVCWLHWLCACTSEAATALIHTPYRRKRCPPICSAA